MTERELYALIEEGLELSAGTIGPQVVVADVEEWGSLGWLTLMALLDERAGVTLGSTEIQKVETVAQLTDLLRTKGAVA